MLHIHIYTYEQNGVYIFINNYFGCYGNMMVSKVSI